MSHGQIKKQTLRFPGRKPGANASAWPYFTAALPGSDADGFAISPPNDTAAVAAYVAGEPEDLKLKLDLLPRNGCPVRYIGIAADSAIETCDISLGGIGSEQSKFRLSPGNPLIGCLDVDFALVSVPDLVAAPHNQGGVVVWDAGDVLDNAGQASPAWALRLEIGYGDILPMRTNERAPMHSRMLAAPTATQQRFFYACVAGRRRVNLTVRTNADTTTVSAFALAAHKQSATPTVDGTDMTPLVLTDAGDLTVDIGADEMQIFSFYGNPFSVLLVQIDQATDDAIVEVHVDAWDK